MLGLGCFGVELNDFTDFPSVKTKTCRFKIMFAILRYFVGTFNRFLNKGKVIHFLPIFSAIFTVLYFCFVFSSSFHQGSTKQDTKTIFYWNSECLDGNMPFFVRLCGFRLKRQPNFLFCAISSELLTAFSKIEKTYTFYHFQYNSDRFM